jgi:ribosomal protein S27E
MNAYHVYVKCPECKNEFYFGLVHNTSVVGSPTPDPVECNFCQRKVVATVSKLELSSPVEDNPIKGGWSR